MKPKILFASISLFLAILVNGQCRIEISEESQQITLENNIFLRSIQYNKEENTFVTKSFKDKRTGYDYWRNGNTREFSFKLDGKEVYGGRGGYFALSDYQIVNLDHGGKSLAVKLTGRPNSAAQSIDLIVYYEIYPNLALVRKHLEIINKKLDDILITDLFWESLHLDPWGGAGADIYGHYGRYWYKPPYIGGVNDPAVLVAGEKGKLIIGNEAPGMMKYISVYYNENNLIRVGMNPSGNDFAFRRSLKSGKSFRTPKTFILLSDEEYVEDVFEKDLAHFMREYMGVKLFERENPPLFCYNTWHPFKINIDEKLVMEIADGLEGTGVEYLIIDDGWQDNYGDWNPHPGKFPNGIKPVCDYIRSKGMKPGIWISLTSVEKASEAFTKYKDMMIRDKDGEDANIHGYANDLSFVTANIATPWYDYMKEKLAGLVKECGIGYVKIDLSMVKSAYIMDLERTGTYDSRENYHGRNEFLYLAYERLMQFYDELAEAFPGLIIDCTFEIWGDWHVIDYALIQHADVDWMSNFTAPPPKGSWDIRNLQWHRSLVIPSSCMIIGNQRIDGPGHEVSYLSNLGHAPILLGDPRNLTDEERQWYKKYSDWYRQMNTRYELHKYLQRSVVFDKPGPGNWDGFARFNPEKEGGIICAFRNGSPDESRGFQLPWVNEESEYEIYSVEDERILGIFEGKVLKDAGLNIGLSEKNSAILLGIELVTKDLSGL